MRKSYVKIGLLALCVSVPFVACTASGDAVESDVVFPIDNGGLPSSDSKSSSSKDSSKIDPSIFNLFDWVQIPKVSITRGVNSFGVNSFAIATTEVTQKIYKFVMNDLPQQSKEGDKRAVSNVNWFRAALFCNAISKLAGLDTAYVYKSISRDSVLVDLSID